MKLTSDTYSAVILMAGVAPITTHWSTCQLARQHAAAAATELARSPELSAAASILIVDDMIGRIVDEYHGPSIQALARMMAWSTMAAARAVGADGYESSDHGENGEPNG